MNLKCVYVGKRAVLNLFTYKINENKALDTSSPFDQEFFCYTVKR